MWRTYWLKKNLDILKRGPKNNPDFFECLAITDILTEIGLNTNISSLVGSTFSRKEAYNGNFIINVIIFYNKQV